MRQSKRYSVLLPVVFFLIACSLLINAIPVQAEKGMSYQNPPDGNRSAQFQVGTPTVTPTPVPMEFTEQELAEGRPVGIIIGAAALVLLVFLGTLITLTRKYNKK